MCQYIFFCSCGKTCCKFTLYFLVLIYFMGLIELMLFASWNLFNSTTKINNEIVTTSLENIKNDWNTDFITSVFVIDLNDRT